MPSSPSSLRDRATPASWYALIVLSFLYVLSLMDRQIIALMVTPLRRDLGLTDVEIGLLEAHGFQPVGMGPRTLRTDTAAVALLTLVNDAVAARR